MHIRVMVYLLVGPLLSPLRSQLDHIINPGAAAPRDVSNEKGSRKLQAVCGTGTVGTVTFAGAEPEP
jgi:hypothetical protein